VRITGTEMRAAYYAIRRRLGYVDAPAPVPRAVIHQSPAGLGMVNSGLGKVRSREAPAPVDITRQGRLLAAKRRASRR
jgi:hypothetical protein